MYSQSVKTDPMADLITVSVSSMLNSAVRALLLLSVVMILIVACPWLLEIKVVIFVTDPNDNTFCGEPIYLTDTNEFRVAGYYEYEVRRSV